MDEELRRAMISELKNLNDYKARLEQLRLDLIDSNKESASSSEGRSNLPGDPTGSAAIREVSIAYEISHIEIKIKKIEVAIASLIKLQQDVIYLTYIDKAAYSVQEIIAQLNISKKHYYNLKIRAIDRMIRVIGAKKLIEWKNVENRTPFVH